MYVLPAVEAIVIVSPVGVNVILLPATKVISSVDASLPVNLIIAFTPLSTVEIVYVVFVSVTLPHSIPVPVDFKT